MYLIMFYRVMFIEEDFFNYVGFFEIIREVGIKSKISWII